MPFHVKQGDPELKTKFQMLLHERGSKETGLEEFLVDLEETESISGSWWAVFNDSDEPLGALTVRYINDLSYLRFVWTRMNTMRDANLASMALINRWIRNPKSGIKKLQADLPLYSPLVKNLIKTGFEKEKVLLTSYDLITDWYDIELPEGYTMRSIRKEELAAIYDDLIHPDLDRSSPIFITKGAFLDFGNQLPDSARNSWVGVEDDKNNLVGFGASFLSLEKNTTRAILYGPHSKEPAVIKTIIGEMLTYWKSKDVVNLRILRVNEFHPNTISLFKMDLGHETIRFSTLK